MGYRRSDRLRGGDCLGGRPLRQGSGEHAGLLPRRSQDSRLGDRAVGDGDAGECHHVHRGPRLGIRRRAGASGDVHQRTAGDGGADRDSGADLSPCRDLQHLRAARTPLRGVDSVAGRAAVPDRPRSRHRRRAVRAGAGAVGRHRLGCQSDHRADGGDRRELHRARRDQRGDLDRRDPDVRAVAGGDPEHGADGFEPARRLERRVRLRRRQRHVRHHRSVARPHRDLLAVGRVDRRRGDAYRLFRYRPESDPASADQPVDRRRAAFAADRRLSAGAADAAVSVHRRDAGGLLPAAWPDRTGQPERAVPALRGQRFPRRDYRAGDCRCLRRGNV